MPKKYNYTMKTGRPTDYRPEFVEEVYKYISENGRENTSLPTIQGFASRIHCSLDAIADWRKKNTDFSGALDELLNKQAEQLINDGIYGGKEVNATIVKLLLQNNHGMKERLDQTSADEKIEQLIVLRSKDDDTTIPVADEGN